MMWTVAWVCLAQVFAAGIYASLGWDQTILFLASYLLEKSLSLDNVFVFLVSGFCHGTDGSNSDFYGLCRTNLATRCSSRRCKHLGTSSQKF